MAINGINSPNWKQYEWLIAKIFHNSHASIFVQVIHNASLEGEYSEIPRQIDVLVTDSETGLKTIVECKNRSDPLDVKDIEEFLGMFDDVKSDHGILISSGGFSKTAHKRITPVKDKITLDVIPWEQAFEAAKGAFIPSRLTDLCTSCYRPEDYGKTVPGLLLWEHGFGLEQEGKIQMFSYGRCLRCKSFSVYCDSCGVTTVIDEDELCCPERDEFISAVEP